MTTFHIPSVQELAGAGIGSVEIAASQKELARDPAVLMERLRMIGFSGLGTIIDAGCGIGHWSAAAAQLNGQVNAFDLNKERLRIAHLIAERNACRNIEFREGSMEQPPFPPGSADAVFFYGVLMYTKPQTSLKAMTALLKPGGRLYVVGLGFGWLFFDYLPQALKTFNWRMLYSFFRMVLKTLGRRCINPDIAGTAFTRREVSQKLRELGLEILEQGDEGTIGAKGKTYTFYQGSYHGWEGCFEVLARKPLV